MAIRRHQIHWDDRSQETAIRAALKQARQDRGETTWQVEERLGPGHQHFVYNLESRAKFDVRIDTMQRWAGAYDLRLEMQLNHFWLYAWEDQEMLTMYTMSRKFEAYDWQVMWLMSALRLWRIRRGVSAWDVANKLGLKHRTAVTWWEVSATNPMLSRLQAQARAVGTSVQLGLWSREDWKF